MGYSGKSSSTGGSSNIVTRDSLGNIATAGNITIPDTTSTTGQLILGSTVFLSNYNNCLFLGGAGNVLTSGTFNLGIGLNCLSLLGSSASSNVSIGSGSLENLVDGTNNIAIGFQEGSVYDSTESFNILIGCSGDEVLGESNVVRIGKQGVPSNVYIATCYSNYGTDNTFVGKLAGNFSLSVGDAFQNTCIGYSSLSVLTTGAGNCAIGATCLSSALDATNNTAIGKECLFSLTSGVGNIAIGVQCGTAYSSTESDNILIGNGVGAVSDVGVIRIGGVSQTSCFISGIYNVSGTGNQVVVDSTGKLCDSGVPSGNPWVDQTSASVTMTTNTGYISNAGASLVEFTLPTISSIGDFVEINGLETGLWTILQASGQQIKVSPTETTSGASGSLSSVNQFDNVRLRCVVADTIWTVEAQQSTGLTVV